MWDELLDTGAWEGEIWNRRKNGETYIEYLAISTVKGKNDEILYYVAVFHDISDLHTIGKRLPLTVPVIT